MRTTKTKFDSLKIDLVFYMLFVQICNKISGICLKFFSDCSLNLIFSREFVPSKGNNRLLSHSAVEMSASSHPKSYDKKYAELLPDYLSKYLFDFCQIDDV